MTQGNITKHIFYFALPLLIGNLFQQLYNTVDTWVVGNYVSNEAYSAVGSVGPIINVLIGIFTGLAGGAGVVISQYYGAKKYDKVHDTVHTTILLTALFSILFTVIGVVFTPQMLDLMKTPDEVRKEASLYLMIYFSGVTGLLFYNMGSGILRAVGDSTHPFYYLVISALTNTVLDLVFVLVFKMGVEGVAYATIIAQIVSAFLVVMRLLKSDNCIRLNVKELKFVFPILKKIFALGIPTAIQLGITAFSNVFVQSYINHFGGDFMSGWTSYAKIDQFMFLPMQSLSLAASTFVGQNLGIDDVKRARKGISIALILSLLSTFVLLIPIMIFARPLTAFFNDKPEVVEYSAMLLRWISPFYLLCCVNQILSGALRGAGNTKIPMLIMLFSFVLFRQAYLYIVANYISNTMLVIAFGYPAGWFVASALTALYYKYAKLSRTRVV
jgi:putative MATE family efflux protein